jgi:hypothetical protein
MTETNLEPAVGRLLVTAEGDTWEIMKIFPDGSLALRDVFSEDISIDHVPFAPDKGEWIARDMRSLETWARLTGVNLK